jgi:branched-chain amino acid transport system permease protein
MINEKYLNLGWGAAVALFVLFLPVIVPEIKIHLAIEILIFALFAISFNLVLGSLGMLAFGFAALFGMGAYIAALMFNHIPGTPLAVVLLAGACSGLLTAFFIAFFCVRLGGTYFALLTLAFQMFFFTVAMKWRAVTNGDDGMGVIRPELYMPGLGKLSLMNINNLYYVTLFFVVLGILAAYLFLKTPFGNSAISMRENDERASFLGYNVFLTKLTVFSFAGFLAGLAGGLYVLFQEFVATTAIDVTMSFTIVIMAIIGGTGRFFGPILGVVFYLLFQDWISDLTDHWWLFLGIVFIAVVLFLEGGLISLINLDRIRLWLSRQES